MREFKFRYYSVGPGDWRGMNYLALENEVWFGEVDPNYPLQQFTGLIDKNGKEVYEGDICRISEIGIRSIDDPDPFTRIIKWDNEIGGFNHFRLDGTASGSGWSFRQSAIGKYYEVVGNIYETPERILPSNIAQGD